MNTVHVKKLQDNGVSESLISVIKDIVAEKERTDLVTNHNLEITKLTLIQQIELVRKDTQQMKLELQKEIQQVKLELQKEIQQVKLELQKEIQQVKLELQKEIQEVRLEIQQVKIDFHKAINKQLWKIIAVLIAILSPLYALVIKIYSVVL